MGSAAKEMPLSILGQMIEAVEDLLGTKDLYWLDGIKVSPPQADAVLTCGFCGRYYDDDGSNDLKDMLCPSDDCAANKARKLIKEQRSVLAARVKSVDDLAGAPCINCQRGAYVSLTPDFYALQCDSCGWSSPPGIIISAYKKAQSFYGRIRTYKDKKGEQSGTTNTTQGGDERHEVP